MADSRDGVKATACPKCLAKLDAATGLAGAERPRPGDFSVCAYCSTILVFEEDRSVREAAPADLDKLDREAYELVARAVAAVRATGCNFCTNVETLRRAISRGSGIPLRSVVVNVPPCPRHGDRSKLLERS